MPEINTVLLCLQPFLGFYHYRQLRVVCEALLMMHGRITMLGISRWTAKGGSYRTLQRFFNTNIDWSLLNWQLLKVFMLKAAEGDVFLIGGDATTVTKSGKTTFGLGRFFSSIYSRTVPGISLQVLSLIDVKGCRSWPLMIEQIMPKPRPAKPKGKAKPKNKQPPRAKGRPTGSKNKNRRDVELNAEMKQVQAMLKRLLALMANTLKPVYFVYDGAFGNNAAIQMTRQVGLHLISKLRNDSALYFRWQGVYSGKGARRRYGKRVDYSQLPAKHLKSEKTEKGILTQIYQFTALHKTCADPLNVVIILKYNASSGKTARIILFSTDQELSADNVVKYYRLRFQIEFNFRDAKQHWGLEDFMVTQQQKVTNAANLSLFMVNLSQAMMRQTGETSVLDLKARYHGLRYAQEAFKILPQKADVINFEDWIKQIPVLGRIHNQRRAA